MNYIMNTKLSILNFLPLNSQAYIVSRNSPANTCHEFVNGARYNQHSAIPDLLIARADSWFTKSTNHLNNIHEPLQIFHQALLLCLMPVAKSDMLISHIYVSMCEKVHLQTISNCYSIFFFYLKTRCTNLLVNS